MGNVFTEDFQASSQPGKWKGQCVIADLYAKRTFICQGSLKPGNFCISLWITCYAWPLDHHWKVFQYTQGEVQPTSAPSTLNKLYACH